MKRYIQSGQFKKSKVYDDVVFLKENLRLLKSIYYLNEGVCTNIWEKENFAILREKFCYGN